MSDAATPRDSVVQDRFRPTLPELLGPRRWRLARPIAPLLALVAAALYLWPEVGVLRSENVVVGRGAVEFNFVYDSPLRQVGPARVEERRRGLLIQSMEVRPFSLPRYVGDPGAALPLLAERLIARLARTQPGFELVSEGRTRINLSPGYHLAWVGRQGERRVFFHEYLLVPEEEVDPHPTRGARLRLVGTYASHVSRPEDVGRAGALKRPLRSFRFGTERPS